MSTWICKPKTLLAAILAVGLAGCSDVPGGSSGGNPFGFLSQAPDRIVVASKSVVIAGPPGYCVDKSSTRDSNTGAFVLLGSCASISNSVLAKAPQTPGLLTASVSSASDTEIARSLDRLESFFESDAGRAALARDGRAQSVQVLETRKTENAFHIHARDSSANTIAGITEDYWRGLLDVRGRIVTVSVVGFAGKPMSPSNGLSTLDAFATRILQENPQQVASAGPDAAKGGFWGRLLQ